MKKIFTLCLAIIGAMNIFAQSVNYTTFQFVDANGKEIKDGSVIEVKANGKKMESGIMVKSAKTTDDKCIITYDVSEMSSGVYELCFVRCIKTITTPTATTETSACNDESFTTLSLADHWAPDSYGTCVTTLQLRKGKLFGTGKKAYWGADLDTKGPKITIKYIYSETTGMNGVTVNSIKELARYSLAGTKLTGPTKGVNIVKYSDGSVKKVVVK